MTEPVTTGPDGAPGVQPPVQPVVPTPPARTLRQRIDDHPAALFVGIALAAATATMGIVLPIAQLTQDSRVASVQAELSQVRAEQELIADDLRTQLDRAERDADAAVAAEHARGQARVDELERSLSGITRSLGDATDYYDVSKLVIEPREAGSIPTTSRFDTTDRFYALDPDQATGWTYEVSDELRLGAAMFGMTEEQLRSQPPEVVEGLTRFPVHVWYFGGDRLVELDDPVTADRLTLHPRTMALLQRVSYEDAIELQLARVPEGAAAAEEVVRNGFARDPSGWVLQDTLVQDVLGSGSLRPRIESLQKRDDIAYGRVETVLPDVTTDGSQLPEYYWTREWLIADTGTDIYLVRLFVGDDDHRSPDYAAVSSWLDGLRIVRS
jgi:hypothetical protein